MSSRIIPSDLRDNITERVGTLEMKSPTYKFKKNMPTISDKKDKNKVAVIGAPVAFTGEELERYEYWLALQSSIPWLYEKPKDNYTKDIVRNFMALYAKIKMAMQKVEPEKVHVSVGISKITGSPVIISREWYETPEEEAAFVTSFFSAYIASITGSEALVNVIKKSKYQHIVQNGRIKKLEEEIKRRDLRIIDLKNAVRKLEEITSLAKDPLARSRGRLQGKRPCRIKVNQKRKG